MRNRWAITRKLVAVGAAVALGLGLAVANSAPAAADGWGESLKPDTWRVTYCFGGAFSNRPALRRAAHYAMANLANQTRYLRTKTDCGSTTDIIWRVFHFDGTRGAYLCVDSSGGYCWQGNIWLNPDMLNNRLNRRKTACHQVGHYGRLVHHQKPYGDCMVYGGVRSGHQHYNRHHVWHLNHSR